MRPSAPIGRFAHSPVAPAAAIAAVAAVALVAQLRFLSTGFAATDSLPLVEASRLVNLESVLRLFTTPVMAGTAFAAGEAVYRPFVSLTFGIDYLVWGAESLGYHMTNLILHLAAVCAVWLLLRVLGLAVWSSALGAIVFAVHPIVLATVPVIGRRDSILPVAAFATATAVLLAAQDASGWRRRALSGNALLLAGVALLSKESAFAAIAMLPALVAGRAFSRGLGPIGSLRGASVTIPFLVLAAALFALRLIILGGLGGKQEIDIVSVDFDRYGQLIGSYVRNLLWAWAGSAPSPREMWQRLAGAIAVWLALTIVWLPRRQAALAAAGAAWIAGFGLFIAVFQIATLGWLAYFSLIGVALLFAAGTEGAFQQLWGTLFPADRTPAPSADRASGPVVSGSGAQVEDRTAESAAESATGFSADPVGARLAGGSGERVAERTAGKVMHTASGLSADRTAERLADHAAGRVADHAAGGLAGGLAELIAEHTDGRLAGRSPERPEDRPGGHLMDSATALSADRAGAQFAGGSAERIAERTAGKIVDRAVGWFSGRAAGLVERLPPGRAAATVGSAALLVGLLVFAGGSLWSSALFRDYPQWQVAGDVEGRFMQALTACLAATPGASNVTLQRVPGDFDDGQAETGMLGVTLIAQYTAESALRLAFPGRQLNVNIESFDTFRGGADALQFSCVGGLNGVMFEALY